MPYSSGLTTTSLILLNTLVSLQIAHVYGRIDLRLFRHHDLPSQQACPLCLTSSSLSSTPVSDENQDAATEDDVSDDELGNGAIRRESFVSNSIARSLDDEDLTKFEQTGEKINGDSQLSQIDKYPTTSERNALVESNAKQALRRFQQWRNDNGYGQVLSSHWGRGRSNSLKKDAARYRRKRSVVGVVEIDLPSGEDMNVDDKNVLDSYLTWRENHGYGTLAGRWGR